MYLEIGLLAPRAGLIHLDLYDLGGLVEEATWHHIPTVILRNTTERYEAVEAGSACLVGMNIQVIQNTLQTLLNESSVMRKKMSRSIFPFGIGNASARILSILRSKLTSDPHLNFMTNYTSTNMTKIIAKNYISQPKVGVILQVYKRNTLEQQLNIIVHQTLLPTTVIILQSGFHVNVSHIIAKFRRKYKNIEIDHIASSRNLKYHKRFHVAYMMKEDWVSIWDDDIQPKTEWLQYCIDYSKQHGNALVGANGRTFKNLTKQRMVQVEKEGVNDFVGHTWTLPRRFLAYYIVSDMIFYHTGEDIQLSFALQKHGIKSMKPEMKGEKSAHDMPVNTVYQHASFLKNQAPRQLLFCLLLRSGFQTVECTNCADHELINECINNYNEEAVNAMTMADKEDIRDNENTIWHAYITSTAAQVPTSPNNLAIRALLISFIMLTIISSGTV